jgi:hypothetical protein
MDAGPQEPLTRVHRMQVKAGKAKATQQQQGRKLDVIRNEEQAAAQAHSEHALQDLFSHWESSMEQVS